MSGWRDIATAPRDGTPIMLYCQYATVVIAYYEVYMDEGWKAVCGGDPVTDWCAPPTHWQPLPTPPEE